MNAILKHTDKGAFLVGEVGNGLFKWTGGCIWDGFLYGFSRTSNSILKMSLDTEKIEYFQVEEEYIQEHHYGGVCTKDGNIYQPPRDSDHILVWDLKSATTRKIYLAPKLHEEKFRYCGSVLHPNGSIYFLPERNEKVIKLDTKTESWSFIGEDIDAMAFDAKVAVDGNIYGYSAYCKGIIKIDAESNLVEMIHQEIRPCLNNGNMTNGERFFRRTRQIFAGILCVFQENLTQFGGKRSAVWACCPFFKQGLVLEHMELNWE